ncbi:hypothetical protein NKH86_11205 [Mesorhizobium sp. M0913]|uniref:hypothetical protein n=1 Tax=Mesorhizobium sp. M0913 TaxID=2957026 RepID=UPI003335A4A3
MKIPSACRIDNIRVQFKAIVREAAERRITKEKLPHILAEFQERNGLEFSKSFFYLMDNNLNRPPPNRLYHYTCAKNLPSIAQRGLLPKDRQGPLVMPDWMRPDLEERYRFTASFVWLSEVKWFRKIPDRQEFLTESRESDHIVRIEIDTYKAAHVIQRISNEESEIYRIRNDVIPTSSLISVCCVDGSFGSTSEIPWRYVMPMCSRNALIEREILVKRDYYVI